MADDGLLTAVLLLSEDSICDRAESHARALFTLIDVRRHPRSQTALSSPLAPAQYLFNFLSSPKVGKAELAKFRLALNFHPAPPEYPGVGSASLALYDRRATHGATAHIMTEEYDSGPIVRVRRFTIAQTTYAALFERARTACLELFFEVLSEIHAGRSIRPTGEIWARRAYTRKEFERHPAFREIA